MAQLRRTELISLADRALSCPKLEKRDDSALVAAQIVQTSQPVIPDKADPSEIESAVEVSNPPVEDEGEPVALLVSQD